ncbi:MAG: metallophosphoesterase family protein [Lawsonibacter sp.]|nr:metallophosphoesterase family protein [Lawsonibacter sp.]
MDKYNCRKAVAFFIVLVLLLSMTCGCSNLVAAITPTIEPMASSTTTYAATDVSPLPTASHTPLEDAGPPSTTDSEATTASGSDAGLATEVSAVRSSSKPSSVPKSTPKKSSTASTAEIRKITVTFYGDAKSSKGFTWYTDLSSKNSDLQVVEISTSPPDFSTATTFTGTEYISHNSSNEYVHKAVAAGLKSNTAYYYRVGDTSLNMWSNLAVFITAPESEPFTFIDISDTQMANQAGAKVVSGIMSEALHIFGDARFIINNGDVIDSKAESQYNLLLGNAQSIFSNTTFMSAPGNHDIGNSCFIDHFNLAARNANTSTGAYYSVDYSNAHFVVLNTNESSSEYAEFSKAQIDWMKADIRAAKKAGATWIIVVMHMGPYSTAEHSLTANVIATREKVAPLFSELGVDLVLQGHDHVYARSKPISGGTAQPETRKTENYSGNSIDYIVNPEGTIYITPGTAGVKYYYQNSSLSQDYLNLFDSANGPTKGGAASLKEETFIGFRIDGNKLTEIAYQAEKDNLQNAHIIDQFGILKDK